MAIIKVSVGGKTATLEKYLKQEHKTDKELMTGKDCYVNKFTKSFEMTKRIYHKREGRQHYHIIQSFKPGETNKQQAHQIGVAFANIEKLQGFQVAIITHIDKEHIHNHIVINSVNQETGKKFRLDNPTFKEIKEKSNELCKEQNLSTINFGKKEYLIPLSMAQIKTREKGISSQERLIKIIKEKSITVKTKEEFINELKNERYEVNWTNRDRLSYVDLELKEKNDKLVLEGKKGVKYKFGERSLSKYNYKNDNDSKISKGTIEKLIEKNMKKYKLVIQVTENFKNIEKEQENERKMIIEKKKEQEIQKEKMIEERKKEKEIERKQMIKDLKEREIRNKNINIMKENIREEKYLFSKEIKEDLQKYNLKFKEISNESSTLNIILPVHSKKVREAIITNQDVNLSKKEINTRIENFYIAYSSEFQEMICNSIYENQKKPEKKLKFEDIVKGNWSEKVVTLENKEKNKELYMYLSNCEKKLVYMSEKKDVLNDIMKRKKPNELAALRDEAKKGFFPISGINIYKLSDEEFEKAKKIDHSDSFELNIENKTLTEKKVYTPEKKEHFRELGLKEIKKEELEQEQELGR